MVDNFQVCHTIVKYIKNLCFSKRRLVGGTAGPEFKRSAQYSTPIVHQMDEQVDVPCQQ